MELVGDINIMAQVGNGLAASAITAGTLVRLEGTVAPACAAVSGQVVPATGFAPYAAASGEAVMIVTGKGHKVTGASGLTAGLPVHLGETAGQVQTAAPVGGGKVVQIVGKAISTTEWLTDFSSEYETL